MKLIPLSIALCGFTSAATFVTDVSFNGGGGTIDFTETTLLSGASSTAVALGCGIDLVATNSTNLDLLSVGTRLIANETISRELDPSPPAVITLTLSGFSATDVVDITGGDNGNANFNTNWTINGATQLVTNAAGTAGGANFTGLTPDANGDIIITLSQNGDNVQHISLQTLNLSVEKIPEPSSAALLGLGGVALLARRKR